MGLKSASSDVVGFFGSRVMRVWLMERRGFSWLKLLNDGGLNLSLDQKCWKNMVTKQSGRQEKGRHILKRGFPQYEVERTTYRQCNKLFIHQPRVLCLMNIMILSRNERQCPKIQKIWKNKNKKKWVNSSTLSYIKVIRDCFSKIYKSLILIDHIWQRYTQTFPWNVTWNDQLFRIDRNVYKFQIPVHLYILFQPSVKKNIGYSKNIG